KGFAGFGILVFAFAAHSGFIQFETWFGNRLLASAKIPDAVWFPGNNWWGTSNESRARVEDAQRHLERAENFGFLSTPTALQDLVWLNLARNDDAAAEAVVRK